MVAALGVCSVQVGSRERRVDVQNHVDAGRVEDGHAFIVLQMGREVVDTDGVDLVYQYSFAIQLAVMRLTPNRCISAASRKQAFGSLNGSFFFEKPPVSPG